LGYSGQRAKAGKTLKKGNGKFQARNEVSFSHGGVGGKALEKKSQRVLRKTKERRDNSQSLLFLEKRRREGEKKGASEIEAQ